MALVLLLPPFSSLVSLNYSFIGLFVVPLVPRDGLDKSDRRVFFDRRWLSVFGPVVVCQDYGRENCEYLNGTVASDCVNDVG